jgi:hypothetical protein
VRVTYLIRPLDDHPMAYKNIPWAIGTKKEKYRAYCNCVARKVFEAMSLDGEYVADLKIEGMAIEQVKKTKDGAA